MSLDIQAVVPRPAIVTLVMWLFLTCGAIAAVATIAFSLATGDHILQIYIALTTAVICLVIGEGFRRGNRSARNFLILLIANNILGALLAGGNWAGTSLWLIGHLALLWYLFRPGVASYFKGTSQPKAPEWWSDEPGRFPGPSSRTEAIKGATTRSTLAALGFALLLGVLLLFAWWNNLPK